MNLRSFLFIFAILFISNTRVFADTDYEFFRLTSEPLIRIGLLTNASSVSIATSDSSLVAVVGMKDDALGEEVKAFVVRKPNATVTESELMAWCKDRMAAYKYPRAIEFKDALPMNATGKILKRELRG